MGRQFLPEVPLANALDPVRPLDPNVATEANGTRDDTDSLCQLETLGDKAAARVCRWSPGFGGFLGAHGLASPAQEPQRTKILGAPWRTGLKNPPVVLGAVRVGFCPRVRFVQDPARVWPLPRLEHRATIGGRVRIAGEFIQCLLVSHLLFSFVKIAHVSGGFG